MNVIVPFDFIANRTKVVSSVAYGTETDPPTAWESGVVYQAGDRVYEEEIDDTPAKIYEALVTVGTTSSTPSVDVTNTVPKWALVGYANKWNMFDTSRDTVTVSSTDIDITLTPGIRINSLAFINMTNVTQIEVTVTDPYSNTLYPTNTIAVTDSYLVLYDLPLNTQSIISINISGTGTISVGALVCGTSYYLGEVQRNMTLNSLNFSTIERDIFGNATVVARRNVPKINKRLVVSSSYVDSIIRVRDELNAAPALWIGLQNNIVPEFYKSAVVMGFYRTFTITMDNEIVATIDLELEEI